MSTPTHCPYCSLQCGIHLTPAPDGGLALAGREDFPVNRGGLCMKGGGAAELIGHPERLTTPLARDRPGHPLKPVSWDDALDRTVAAIERAQAGHGRDAVGCFGGGGLTNEKAYQLGKFARVALRTANIDYNGRFCMSSAAAAGNRSFGIDRGLPFPFSDIAEADVVLLVVHANIQRDGTFSVVPRMAGGVTTSDELRRIADTADRYDIPLIKVTGGQRIDLLGVRKEDLPAVWDDLAMPSGFAYGKSMRTVKTCVGRGLLPVRPGRLHPARHRHRGAVSGIESPAKMKLAVSGCPRNCAESMVKDIGIVGVGDDRWELYIGGAAGASIRKGDVLTTVDGRDEAIRLTGVFMQYYRENGKWLERTYDFVPRVGLDELKALLVDDRDGIVAGLEERMQTAVDAYVDPWTEGRTPATAGQFSDALPLIPLPVVPVRDGSTSPNGAMA